MGSRLWAAGRIGQEGVRELLYSGRLVHPGKPFQSTDVAVLDKYDQRIAGKHCFQHCGACLDACPEQLRIDDVLRHRIVTTYEAEAEGRDTDDLAAAILAHVEVP